MKLLIFTQKIDRNDDVLGFFHGWIAEFAKHCDEVIAVGLFVGEHDLPKNVRVYSLGKEGGVSRIKYLWNFFRIIWNERKNYDAVFVHMNQVYVLLGGIFWKLIGKKVALWYTHKQVDISLRTAVIFADIIFTASIESFRIPTIKRHVMGHGINVADYRKVGLVPDPVFRIISIGRVSRTKGYDILFDALEILKQEGVAIRTHIVGGPLTDEDKIYMNALRADVARRGFDTDVVWVGPVSHHAILPYLAQADLFVNMSGTGSLDKAVLEAMAAGVPVLTSNPGLESTLLPLRDICMFSGGETNDFVSHIRSFVDKDQAGRQALGAKLQDIVSSSHDISSLIPRIIAQY